MIKEITVTELKQMIDEGVDYQLIDVREPYERDIANIGGENIPLGQIQLIKDSIQKDKKVVIYCRSGSRSGSVVSSLQNELGIDNLYNLKGGILAWSDEIDASIQKY